MAAVMRLVDVPDLQAREDITEQGRAELVEETFDELEFFLAVAIRSHARLGRALDDAAQGLVHLRRRHHGDQGAPAAAVSILELLGALGRLKECAIEQDELVEDMHEQARHLPMGLVVSGGAEAASQTG